MPPATGAEANNLARKSSPLPRKTLAKNLSSYSRRRSRTTPMNQRKAMPAKGSRLSATWTGLASPASHPPASCGSAGMERRTSTRLTMSSRAKRMPATAVARWRGQSRAGQGARFVHKSPLAGSVARKHTAPPNGSGVQCVETNHTTVAPAAIDPKRPTEGAVSSDAFRPRQGLDIPIHARLHASPVSLSLRPLICSARPFTAVRLSARSIYGRASHPFMASPARR